MTSREGFSCWSRLTDDIYVSIMINFKQSNGGKLTKPSAGASKVLSMTVPETLLQRLLWAHRYSRLSLLNVCNKVAYPTLISSFVITIPWLFSGESRQNFAAYSFSHSCVNNLGFSEGYVGGTIQRILVVFRVAQAWLVLNIGQCFCRIVQPANKSHVLNLKTSRYSRCCNYLYSDTLFT